MAGQLPFLNSSGVNLLPLLGKPLGNPQQFLNQINSLRMPRLNTNQESFSQESNRRQRMQFSDDHYNRKPPDIHGDGPFREPYNREEDNNYAGENRDRIRGLMDRPIPETFLFPEMGTDRYNERQRRDDFERQNYGASTNRQTPIRPSSESRDQEGSTRESKYGFRNDATVPWNALLRRNCYLVPPLDDTYVLALSEKQPGCRTVFIGGLPSIADEEIIREIFSVCGPIEKITMNSARANNQVKHCQVRFVQYDSLERAVKFNGHVLVIGDGNDVKTKIGRIRVDYDKLPSNNITEIDSSVPQKQPQSQMEEKPSSLLYNRKEAFHVLDLIRHDQAIRESLDMVVHWFEKGECNRSTVNVFHSLLTTINSLIKRLINRRKEHEQRVEKQKQQAVETANDIKQQCEAVWKVFEAATKKRSWDHFTKAQRKNITQWQGAIKNEIKSAKEAEFENRVEVGMDLDDEVPSMAGLIEQPALQIAEEEEKEQQGQDQTHLSPSKAKKRRVEAQESDADSSDALKLENKKLRTQVGSLKAIAEQNTSLMWSMQNYQYQAEQIKQQYSNLVAQKDYEIFQLKNALKGANILSDPQRAMSELEIVVDMSKGDPNTTDVVLETGEEVAGKNSKEGKGEEMKEGEAETDENAEKNNESEEVKESSAQLSGGQDSGEQQVDVSNNEEISSTNQAEHKGTLEEKDLDRERDTVNSERREIEIGESRIEDGMEEEEVEKFRNEEENLEEGCQGDDLEGQGEEGGKREEQIPVENEAGNEENQATEEAIQQEDMEVEEGTAAEEEEEIQEEDKEEQEGPAVEEEEGSGRFVEIDDEQFEVIDDMDEEDSDDDDDDGDDYKKVTVPSFVDENDKVNEQLATESSVNQPDISVQKTQDSEDDYKEVTTVPLTAMSEDNDQVKDPFAADSSYYDYAAQYQAWLLSPAATINYGPSQVRISGEELVLVGIVCSYLQLCPSGATSGEIRDYLSRQFKERRKEVVERLLYGLPVLFKADDASGNAKWKFCGFENLAEFKGAKT